ncbi:MAG: DNA-deoxyinosine glycosylase [Clostridia bacterium]|nr:DNA-deoxyinosine glycosylase [Clostridia bacterium]
MRISGFPPIASKDARALILGSMPSAASLEKQQYYGHPRNAFWRMLYTIYGEPYQEDYETRCRFLIRHRIALWDVYASCEREGSLDQNIRSEQFNPLADLIRELPDLKVILCNGSTSYNAFKKYSKEQETALPFLRMISTSPAAAGTSFMQKAEQWKILLQYTESRSD